ncbi:CHRD domain containing protein kinase superfamily protein [Klebsormidium nitens]|uniref:CHRD domain containing protein kinase superfamily protein n=1 Tax=Klebsormidium nitens TaxID=105231 RepID=A0A1Y1IM04_KLENI|nr:CHRD domain containing protein kinase superfamily protein [Klebsormidium nitens]|eukprot:GAQ89816.1 CHRD domain containing protein kinase superfamily protein [Klebsormidium nitens]
MAALLTIFCLASAFTGALGSRELLQTDGNAPSPQPAPPQNGITFMVYFTSAVVNVTDPLLAGSGSIILTLGDSPQAENNMTTALSYRELTFYPGGAVPLFSGKHVHTRAKGPFIQYFIDFGVGSIPLDLRSYLTLVTNPATYFVQLHSNSVPATPTNPFRAWAEGNLPSLVLTIPLTDPAGSGLAGNASLSFQDDAVCLYNLNLPFFVPPGTLEVDVIDAGERAPLLIFNLNTGNTTGVCIPAAQEQVDTITSNLQNYRLSIPQQTGLVSTALTGALDSSVHVVTLYGATSSTSEGTSLSSALGQLKLTSPSPASLCYFDLKLSPLVAGNVTGIALQGGTQTNPGPPLVTFLPVSGANVNTSRAGCVVNVSADVMAAYLTGTLSNGTFFNVSTSSHPSGALQGPVLALGALPVPLALPPAPAPATKLAPALAPGAAPAFSGPLAAVANQSTIDFMVYFTSANVNNTIPFPATGSVILSLPDVIPPSLSLSYREFRLYTGQEQSGTISGVHIHKTGPVYYQLTLALGSGSIVVNASDALAMLANPAPYFVELHSTTVPTTPASPFRSWTRGFFPKLTTVVVLDSPDTGAAAATRPRATVQVSFHETAVCAHNVQFSGLAPPLTTEVDFINGTQTLPTLSITFPVGTTGHCVPLGSGQMADITAHMENYRISIPVSGGGQLSLSGRLDNSVRQVGLASAAEQGPVVNNGGIGLVRLVALTPRALCFWQLQMSPTIANVTAMHLHQGGPTETGAVLIPFYPVPGTNLPTNPLSGCVTNVSDGAISLYAADLPSTYFNVHNVQYPGGVVRGQLPPFGTVPPSLPTPEQIRGGAAAAAPPTSESSSGGVSAALIAAIAGAAAAALLVAVIIGVCLCRRKARRDTADRNEHLGVSTKTAGLAQDNGWAWHGPDSGTNLPPPSPYSGATGRSSRRSGTPQRSDTHRLPSEPLSSSNFSDDVSGETRPRYWRDAGPEGRSGEARSEPSSFGRQVAAIRSQATDSPGSLKRLSESRSSADTSVQFSLEDDIASLVKLSFKDVLEMTNSFQAEDVIGEGGFGVVYRGALPDGSVVAVKRACREAMRSSREFRTEVKLLSRLHHQCLEAHMDRTCDDSVGVRTEVKLLSRLHHQNLVQLVAFCMEATEQILVYKYLPNGSLRSWLQQGGANKHRTRLSFMARLQIALGTANGLNYLHTGASPRVIHRDVKSGNILLDDDFTAKVSDFGLGCIASLNESRGYQSNVVCGTPGYVDPEYYETARVTDKSDVYAYGVVLLELLTGRSAVPKQGAAQHKNLAREMRPVLNDPPALQTFLEPVVAEQASPLSIAALASVAARCLAVTGIERPTMAEVAFEVQSVLRLEEAHRMETGAPPDSPESVANHTTERGGVLVHSMVQGR